MMPLLDIIIKPTKKDSNSLLNGQVKDLSEFLWQINAEM